MTEPHDERPYLAEWWPRVGATLLDLLIVGAMSIGALIVAAIIALAPFGGDERHRRAGVAAADAVVLAIAYFAGPMARKGAHNGQTLGKQAAGIRVVRDDGRPVDLRDRVRARRPAQVRRRRHRRSASAGSSTRCGRSARRRTARCTTSTVNTHVVIDHAAAAAADPSSQQPAVQ